MISEKLFNQHGMSIVSDMDLFIAYIKTNQPILTTKNRHLSPKDCYELNEEVSIQIEVDRPTKKQTSYEYLDFMFTLATCSGLFEVQEDYRNKLMLVSTEFFECYQSSHAYEKYVFLIANYWRNYPFDELSIQYAAGYLVTCFNVAKGDLTTPLLDLANMNVFLSNRVPLLRTLIYFGLCEEVAYRFENTDEANFVQSALMKTAFGEQIVKALLACGLRQWNHRECHFIVSQLNLNQGEACDLEEGLRAIFPLNSSTLCVKKKEPALDKASVYHIKAMFKRHVWVTIAIGPKHSLHDLHQIMMSAFDFEDDHLYEFNLAMNKRDRGKLYVGNPFGGDAASTLLKSLRLKEGQEFTYIHDFGHEKHVRLSVEEIVKTDGFEKLPKLIASKGC